MSLTVLERPLGIGLGTCVTARIDEDYANYATISTTLPHNLAEDDYVYVSCNVEDYNGFWPIHFIDGYNFFLKNPDGTYVAYIVTVDITYCPESFRHGWSCAHLPITYKISSNLFPTNEVDTSRTVSSFTDDNGYVNLNLSGSLGTFEELQFVKISGASTEDVNGVFQVLDKISNSDITINLAYDATYSFSGGTVILYYSSYHIIVNVYAGLNSTHPWVSIKPYEIAATLRFIPDSNNEIKFSISEILKAYINIRNNTLLATLPNNTDFFTQFYISIGESYDQTDGYTITTYETSMTSDQDNFEGVAANAILEFKNQQSGYLSEYLAYTNTAQFLTLFTNPVLFSGYYFDISLMIPASTDAFIRKQFYLNDVLQATEDVTLDNYGLGIYRLILENIGCTYDQLNITFYRTLDLPALTEFYNVAGAGVDWTTGAAPTVTLNIGQTSDPLRVDYILDPGTYEFTITKTFNALSIITIYFKKASTVVESISTDGVFEITLSTSIDNIEIITTRVPIAGTATAEITAFDFVTSGDVQSSETKEITIDCECSNQDIYLTWLNNLGGYDYWKFTGFKDHVRSIGETTQIKKNIFTNWPKSYGEKAQSIVKKTSKKSTKQIIVRSQDVTLEQLQAIEYIKSSIDVYIMESRSNLRSVEVDSDSFVSWEEKNKTYSISFTITYTDDIPSQRV